VNEFIVDDRGRVTVDARAGMDGDR
jgi:hypothetical protein